MSDAKWTSATTQQAIALWVGGKDVAEIALEFGVAPGEVLSRIAQAAIAGDDATTAAGEAPGAAPADAAPPRIAAPKSVSSKAPAATKTPSSKTSAVKIPRAEAVSEPSKGIGTVVPSTDGVPMRPVPESGRTIVAANAASAARAPRLPSSGPAAEGGSPTSRPAPLRLVPTPPALLVGETPDAAPSADAPVAARGYEAVALPAPVRTSKRLLVAADGGAGVPFMKATTLDCHFPLWADTETVSIERKRVCGCRALAGKSWCAHHLSAVFEPPRKPQPRVA